MQEIRKFGILCVSGLFHRTGTNDAERTSTGEISFSLKHRRHKKKTTTYAMLCMSFLLTSWNVHRAPKARENRYLRPENAHNIC